MVIMKTDSAIKEMTKNTENWKLHYGITNWEDEALF